VSKDTLERRLSSRRNVMKASFGAISLASSAGLASANSNDVSEVKDGNELQKVDENDSYALFKIERRDATQYFKTNKETGRTNYVEATELSKQHGLEQAEVSVATVPQSAGVEIVLRSDGYFKNIESCAGGCDQHWVRGASHELNNTLVDVSKKAIAGAIIAASIYTAGVAALITSVGRAAAKGAVKGILAGVGLSQIEGNTFTTAAVDTDFKFFLSIEEMQYLGMALGPWKPGGSALLSPLTPVPGHFNDCS
jgi:hypothetical protein